MKHERIIAMALVTLTLANLRLETVYGAPMNKPDIPRNLGSPKETHTDTSAVLIWDKPHVYNGIASYNVYRNGEMIANTKKTCYKAEGLVPSAEHVFFVKAIDIHGSESESGNEVKAITASPGEIIDVTKAPYGAVGDGVTVCTKMIQQAIDECPKGGIVHVPQGIFVTSGLFLKSDMTLKLDGTLLGSLNVDDYPHVICRFGPFSQFHASMINVGGVADPIVRNVKILGSGTINGNGEALRPKFESHAPHASYCERNSNFTSVNCEGLYVDGITIRNSACWSVHPIWTDHITFYGIYLNNGVPYQ